MDDDLPLAFRHLLVPLDGSRLAEAVLPAVMCLAGRFQAAVTLLHILEQRAPAMVHGERHLTDVAEAEGYLGSMAMGLRAAGVAVRTHVHASRETDVARSIVDHTHELAPDLIVLCAHGRGGLRGMLYGSIAQQVLQQSTCPILVLRPTDAGGASPFHPRRILVPLDGTAAHEPALPVAVAIARAFDATLHLVMVIPTLATLSRERAATGMLLPTTTQALLDMAEQGGADYLAHIAAQCRADGLAVLAEIARGDAVPALLACAARVDADLLVLASHGRAGIDALLTGSVAPCLARRAISPLLLVRASAQGEGDDQRAPTGPP